MCTSCCSLESHEAMKRVEEVWWNCTEPLGVITEYSEDEEQQEETLQYANCVRCSSTLARRIDDTGSFVKGG